MNTFPITKIVGVSGAQGQGKSTLIASIVERYPSVDSYNIQTARELLSDWGYSLTEVNAYMPLKIKFQEELFDRHCGYLEKVIKPNTYHGPILLVERTFADIFTYALTSVGPFNNYSTWLNEYADRCRIAQLKYFSHVVFLSGREYVPHDDGVRSINRHFSNLTDYLILHYTNEFSKGYESRITFITEPDLELRTLQLIDICNNIETDTL